MIREFIDQFFHFAWAATVVGILAIFGISWWSGAIAGFVLCAPREFIDQWHGWPIGWKKLMDVGYFILGGAAAGTIL